MKFGIEELIKSKKVIEKPNNGRKPTKFVEYQGRMYSFSELAKLSPVSAETLRYRIDYLGWDVEKAVTKRCQRDFSNNDY